MNPSAITLGELAKPLHGYYFKDGNLFRFDKKQDVMIQPWPGLKAWSRTRRGDWMPDFESVDSVMSSVFQLWSKFVISDACGTLPSSPRGEARDSSALISFLAGIPSELRNEVSRYEERCWYMLRMFTEFPESIDLSRSNPALALAIANSHEFVDRNMKASLLLKGTLLSGKQRGILSWLGFPGSDAARRILKKVSPQGLTVKNLNSLREALKSDKKVKLLSHLPLLNRHVLNAVSHEAFHYFLNPRLLESLSEQPDLDPDIDGLLRYILDTGKMIKSIENISVSLPGSLLDAEDKLFLDKTLKKIITMAANISSCSNILAFHDRASEMHREARRRISRKVDFSAPPYPGDKDLVPVTTVNDLILEGEEMHNCVASYESDVLSGYVYIYRLLSPVRATVSVVRDGRSDNWRVDDVRSYCNAPVDDDIVALIDRKLSNIATIWHDVICREFQ